MWEAAQQGHAANVCDIFPATTPLEKAAALRIAAINDHAGVVEAMLQCALDSKGATALAMGPAIRAGSSAVVALLLGEGFSADTVLTQLHNMTLLQGAASRGHIPVVALLLGAKADISKRGRTSGQAALPA